MHKFHGSMQPEGTVLPYGSPDGAFYSAADMFLQELEKTATDLEAGILPGDGLKLFGHRMRGVAGVFGAMDTEAAAAALEHACRGDMEAPVRLLLIRAMIVAMRKDASDLRRALGRHLAGSAPVPVADPARSREMAVRAVAHDTAPSRRPIATRVRLRRVAD